MKGLPRYNFRVRSLGLKFDVPFLEKFRGRLIKKTYSVRKKLLRTNDAHVHCMWLKCKLDLRKAGGVQGRHKGFNLTRVHQTMAARIRALSATRNSAGQITARILSAKKVKTGQANDTNDTH